MIVLVDDRFTGDLIYLINDTPTQPSTKTSCLVRTSKHGLVPEDHARTLFDDLVGRLITSGPIAGWSNFQANEALLKSLAALVWASSTKAAGTLLKQLAPLAERGGHGWTTSAHRDLVLGCARVHPELVKEAARQFADLVSGSEQAIPASLEGAMRRLAPAREDLSERLLAAFTAGKAPWLASALVELDVRHPAVVDHVNAALDRAAVPRVYEPNAVSFGSDVVTVAKLSRVGDPARRERFVAAMLDIALEPREPYGGRREAVDAIAVVTQQCGIASLGEELLTKIRNAIRLVANGQVATSIDDDDFEFPLLGTRPALITAAGRLLLVLSDDDDERDRLIRTLLLTLLDKEIDDPRLLRSALAQVSAEYFRNDLLVLASSRSQTIRTLAARLWTELPATDPGIGQRLATDPAGVVRLQRLNSQG